MASASISPNMAAFLTVIRKAEGTDTANGYRYLFGSTPTNEKLFTSFADHPRKYAKFTDLSGATKNTSAAGAYQFISTTWDRIKNKLGLPDFSPQSQDLAAIELIKENGAYNDVEAGNLEAAVSKLRKVWASLPGSNVNQPTRSMATIRLWFDQAREWFIYQPTSTKLGVSLISILLIVGIVYTGYRALGKK